MSSQDEKSPSGKGLLRRAGVGSGGWKPGAIINQVKADRAAGRAARASDAEQKASEGLAGERRASRARPVSPLRPSSSDTTLAAGEQAQGSTTPTTGGSDTATGEVERRKSPVPTGWYPGKFLGVGVRKAINKKLKATNLEEVQVRKDGAKVVGRLRWRLKSVRGLNVFNPYFEVTFEGTKRVIKARTFQEEVIEEPRVTAQGRDQWTETEFVFDVTDITASVYVLLLDKRLRTFTVGALILPLANFVGMRGAKPRQTLVCDLVRPDFLDLDRKPLIGQKYAPLLSPDPSANGPYTVVGEVTVEMELTLDHSVLNTYLVSSPLMGHSFLRPQRSKRREDEEEETLESLDMGQLIVNVYRLKRSLTAPPLLGKLLDWPFLFLPLWSYACLCFAPWKAPWYALLCYTANGYLNSRSVLPPQFEAWPAPLIEKAEAAKATRAMEKIKKIKALFGWLQDRLGRVASSIERSTNAWNWSDPHVTFTMNVVTLPAVGVTSLLLYCVPVHWLVYSLGLLAYGRATVRRHRPPEAAAKPPPSEEEEEDEEDEEELKILDLQWTHIVNPRFLLPRLASNVLGRTPDYPEVLHRAIAARRVRPITGS